MRVNMLCNYILHIIGKLSVNSNISLLVSSYVRFRSIAQYLTHFLPFFLAIKKKCLQCKELHVQWK
jgi:hypothetical protein